MHTRLQAATALAASSSVQASGESPVHAVASWEQMEGHGRAMEGRWKGMEGHGRAMEGHGSAWKLLTSSREPASYSVAAAAAA